MSEDRQQRRLATILAADVFGYSRLTAENEEDTLRTLKAHRAVIDRLIARHDGRIFNTAGDSVLAEFDSAVEAVRCAITVQEELRVRNAQIDEKRRMEFRIGINVGDVLVDGDNLYGDGINIAARLESIAAPGSICISGSVFALVKNKLSYGFEDIGLQTMKNIPEPVPAFRLAASAIAEDTPKAGLAVRRRIMPVAAAALALAVIAGGGIFYWSEHGNAPAAVPISMPTSPTAPAPSAVTPALDAATLARMRPYVDNTVQGISTVTGKPFVMTLKADGAAEVKVEFATSGYSLDQGNWWVEPNGHFCVRYTRFAGGNLVCRPLVVEPDGIKAYTRDHQPNPWVFKK